MDSLANRQPAMPIPGIGRVSRMGAGLPGIDGKGLGGEARVERLYLLQQHSGRRGRSGLLAAGGRRFTGNRQLGPALHQLGIQQRQQRRVQRGHFQIEQRLFHATYAATV